MTRLHRIAEVGLCLDDANTFGAATGLHIHRACDPKCDDAAQARSNVDAVRSARLAWGSAAWALRHIEALERDAVAQARRDGAL
ncbi:MAG: hypothetical protein IPO08_21680 [Xanthomonadales bacterium]|nr:hypothetical protein [Xanthomonadales bacterium]